MSSHRQINNLWAGVKKHQQKGGDKMKYCKPEIVRVGSAVEVIQSGLTKSSSGIDSQGGEYTAPSAYQSDE